MDFDLSTLQGPHTGVNDFDTRKHFEILAVSQSYSLRIEGEVESRADSYGNNIWNRVRCVVPTTHQARGHPEGL